MGSDYTFCQYISQVNRERLFNVIATCKWPAEAGPYYHTIAMQPRGRPPPLMGKFFNPRDLIISTRITCPLSSRSVASFAISGTTIALALMSNSFIPPTNRSSLHRSGTYSFGYSSQLGVKVFIMQWCNRVSGHNPFSPWHTLNTCYYRYLKKNLRVSMCQSMCQSYMKYWYV